MSKLDCNVEIQENPEVSARELGDRIENGTAFVIGAPGISRKERRRLEKDALKKLNGKGTPLKYHVVSFGDAVFEVVE